MNGPRISIRTLMVLVGLAAVDFAVVRFDKSARHAVLGGIVLSVVVLNAGVFCLTRAKGRRRAFWAGFILAGILAAGSYAWARSYPKLSATFIDQATGRQVTIHSPGAPLSDQWENYLTLVDDWWNSVSDQLNPLRNGELAVICADALTAFMPQLLAALAGGLLVWLLAWTLGRSIGRGDRPEEEIVVSSGARGER
jgi:hypothetical protein